MQCSVYAQAIRGLVCLSLAAWLIAACSSSGDGNGGSNARCVTGVSLACDCTDGRTGAQLCPSDGTYGACTCAGGSSGAAGSGSGGGSSSGGSLEEAGAGDAGMDSTVAQDGGTDATLGSMDSSAEVGRCIPAPSSDAGCSVPCCAYAPSTAQCVNGGTQCLVTLATLAYDQSATALVVDSTSAYWANAESDGGTIMKVPLGGGTPVMLAYGQNSPASIVVDPESVYWGTTGGSPAIAKVPIDGGTVVTLASGVDAPGLMAIDSKNVYWGGSAGTVQAVAVGGGSVTTLASSQGSLSGLAVNASGLYWTNGNVVQSTGIGTTATIANQGNAYSGLALDSSFAYYASASIGGDVYRVPLDGGTAAPLASNIPYATGIGVDATNVYWELQGTGYFYTTALPVGGPGTLFLEESSTTTSGAWGINGVSSFVVDSTSLYWIEKDHFSDDGGSNGTYSIKRLTPKLPPGAETGRDAGVDGSSATGPGPCIPPDAGDAGCSVPCCAYAPSTARCVNGGTQCLVTLATLASGQSGAALAVDSANVYWASASQEGTIMKVPHAGGAPVMLAYGQNSPASIVVDPESVYWGTTGGSPAVAKVPIDGGTVVTLASGVDAPGLMAIDSKNVYWGGSAGTVQAVAVGGGSVTTLASSQGSLSGLAANASGLYWTNGNVVQSTGIGTTATIANLGNAHSALALDSSFAYYESIAYSGAVWKVPLAGGAATQLASNISYPTGIGVDATNVYWNGEGMGYFYTTTLPNGGAATNFFVEGSTTAGGGWVVDPVSSLVLDSTSLYWVEQDSVSKAYRIMRLTPKVR